ncbi:MAG: hypothetical protein IJM23_09905 [Lachnospiraceae bacterium]|nr:hypothetical protein [Lachnospiraceae bacterium]
MEDFLLSTFDNLIEPFEEWKKKSPETFRIFMEVFGLIVTLASSVLGALLGLKLSGLL